MSQEKFNVVVYTKTGREIIFKDVTGYIFSDGNVTIYDSGKPIGNIPEGSFEAVFRDMPKDE